MKITLEFLEKYSACEEGLIYFKEKYTEIEHDKLIEQLNIDNKHEWSNWLITRLLTEENCVRYAIYAAELVLHIFENRYPKDNRPINAIEEAKKYLENKTYSASYASAYAANAAAYAANAANAAAYAANAANAAAYAANAAAYASAYAANAANAAAYAAKKELYKKIINYGLELIKNQEINNDN